MSVEHLICVGEGFVLTDEELDKLREMFPDFVEDDKGEEYFTTINQWTCDEGVFVGPVKRFDVEECKIHTINSLRDIISLERIDEFKQWLKENEEKFLIFRDNYKITTHIFIQTL